jgi:hypothetical protein
MNMNFLLIPKSPPPASEPGFSTHIKIHRKPLLKITNQPAASLFLTHITYSKHSTTCFQILHHQRVFFDVVSLHPTIPLKPTAESPEPEVEIEIVAAL